MGDFMMQSNAIRGEYKDQILDKTIKEIHDDIVTVFGPGAADAYITKDGQPYYTRDGLEVLGSLTFDNKLSEYVRKMIYQAAYDQGKKVGDGTTTMTVFYTNLYRRLTEDDSFTGSLNYARKHWKDAIDHLVHEIKKYSSPLSVETLLSMMYTCTQDAEFTAKVYNKLKDAILEGAYIIPKKSNIESDLEITSYTNPLIKATRQFTLRPMKKVEEKTVIFHCNGMLDIVHPETYYGMISVPIQKPLEITSIDGPTHEDVYVNIVLLCNGITEATRRSTKEFVHFMKEHNLDVNRYHNIAIYTIDNYRSMDNETIDDLSTIITDEPGLGGLVNSLSFESNLYQAFNIREAAGAPIDDLETFDADLHVLDKLREMFIHFYPVQFDDVEGIMLQKPLGEYSQMQYNKLRQEIKEEKSEVRKLQLQKRLKAVYGQFIEVEVGSKLLKDSQRKFELLLDMLISSLEANEHGILRSNSILVAIRAIHEMKMDSISTFATDILYLIEDALLDTIVDMASNVFYIDTDHITDIKGIISNAIDEGNLNEFDMEESAAVSTMIPKMYTMENMKNPAIEVELMDGEKLTIDRHIVEPVTVITNMLQNSVIMLELAMGRTFHVDGFLQNYI